MEQLLETLVVAVKADTRALKPALASAKTELDILEAGANRIFRGLENSLVQFARTGKLSFEQLKQSALSALNSIAAQVIKSNLRALFGGGSFGEIISNFPILGLPGRATGGQVTQSRPYLVGERGPELFVPEAAGRIEPVRQAARSIHITVNVSGQAAAEPRLLAQSANQVAASVRRALDRAQRDL